jgi:hypothetical protein
MGRPIKPYVTTLDKVKITRHGDTASIEYLEPGIGGTNLVLGPRINQMSNQDILDCHNELIETRDRLASEYHHEAVEIPQGKPQVRYFKEGDQWVPRGDILRCFVHDDENGRLVVEIDDREFTLEEFGKMLTIFAGWGMRIAFVPEDDLGTEPTIVVKEPEGE